MSEELDPKTRIYCGKGHQTPKFMFAIVSEDTAGQTIQLFKTKAQADKYMEKLI